MSELERIKRKRTAHRGLCTKLCSKIEIALNNKDSAIVEFEVLMDQTVDKIENLKMLDRSVQDLLDLEELESDIASAEEYNEKLLMFKSKLSRRIKEINSTGETNLGKLKKSASSEILLDQNMKSKVQVKLPKLSIGKYYGDPSNWLEFWNQFESAIHENETLNSVDKFNYLKSLCGGIALNAISGLSLNEENYTSAIDILKERFGRKDLTINAHMNRLLNLEGVKSSSNTIGLRKLYDEIEINIRSLKTLKVTSGTYGHLLYPILLKLLPDDLTLEFNRQRKLKTEVDVTELTEFLKTEVECRESAFYLNSKKTPPVSASYNRTKFEIKKGTRIPSASALVTGTKFGCIFCEESHDSNKCKSLTNEQKRYKLKKEGRCYRCMANKHLISQCKVRIHPCEICQSFQHNSLFCPKTRNNNTPQNNSPEETRITQIPDNQTVVSSVLKSQNYMKSYTTLLQTSTVQVENGSKRLIARLLFDSGSQKSFIRKDLAKALKAVPIRKEKLLIYTFSKRNPSELEFELVNITLRSRFPPYPHINIQALVTEEISGAQIHSNINPQLLQNILPDNCEIADQLLEIRPLQILLGADYMYSTLIGSVKKINKNLYLQPTLFGNTLAGQIPDGQSAHGTSCLKVFCSAPENDLKRLWDMESFLLSNELGREKIADNLSDFQTRLRFIRGRYEAPLLWKSENLRESLSDNLEVARKRFAALEKKFNNDELLFERYNAVMKEQLTEGIIEMCNENCFVGYTMPHRDVFKENSSSTKTRIVYDASSKQGVNSSLNECLLSGENLNANLVDVILKFREHKIGFCGDIARAFLQIQVSDTDRNYLCFLYYKNCDKNQPVTMYHFNRHCFGVTCSPYVLAATIKTHIKSYKETHPLAYEMLSKSLYVDDLFFGSSTVQGAFELSCDAVSILKDANMTMRKFDTNSKELKDLWVNSNSPIEINEHPGSHLKALGLVWNSEEDTLGLDLKSLLSSLDYNDCTKRNVLHTAAKIFDPAGFISPFMIRIKCLLQELWQLGVEWDEVFSGEIKEKWQAWCKEIKDLQKLNVPRYYFYDTNLISGENLQLHVFSDASVKAFGAVAYFRYKTSQDTFQTSFVISKSRVAPIKRLTLPRLELMGAIIAARLVKHLTEIFKNIEKVILWSDSTIVLHWIKGSASKYKPFVSNRVTEIQEVTDPGAWRHCIGKHNPADLLTRGTTSNDLKTSQKWFFGPEWLSCPENTWPRAKGFEYDSIGPEIESECRSSILINSAITHEKITHPDRYSSLSRLLRVTAWVLRFLNALKEKQSKGGPLTSDELMSAEQYWIRSVQNDSFSIEITCLKKGKPLPKDSKLLCLNPFLDLEGVLRVTGRLGKTHLSTDEKHPVILPSKSKLTELLIWESHERVFHSGVSHTLAQVREKYWILKARQTIKSLLSKCVICKRFNSSPGSQMVAPLPADRVEQSAPFSIVGVDFAGPLFVKDSEHKQYILLLTCAVTRSIHLELVGSLSTDSFLLAFRRFISRRGLCSVVISDNARTFKRAELELKQIWSVINHPEVKKFYASNRIKWKYIVERAAWWGGFYERMVRTVKEALRKTLGKSSLKIDELQTVLIEIEGMINSRPITYVGSDTEEPNALTPAHFLLGKRLSSLPSVRLHLDSNFSSRKSLIKAFNYREKLMNFFWSRWKREYLLNLKSAHYSLVKNNIPQFKVNDIVLIKDDHLPRNFWKLGRILELFPGRDGKVRACKIKTDSSVIKRPVQLLYNLELQN